MRLIYLFLAGAAAGLVAIGLLRRHMRNELSHDWGEVGLY